MNVDGKTYLWLGAEGLSEESALVRPVSDDAEGDRVLAAALEQVGGTVTLSTEDLRRHLTTDHTKRPYWLVEVLGSAPEDLRRRAARKLRTVRLEDL